ncbi:hypothetical protein COT48_04440 [Candidatus Woesearchaeota archaeon CG08_land_8_20_14_0_20_47_9]|nr:MAG: hypothetical protein AUJ69_03935 [Candidatus Woesearchaeota archaeon CG1_02_47_18]PIN71818.1 MAG: hypothetical protein COV22_04770 [Candidatus Woesearchaeota archaeon CG10_big_fil_rev_8_21_14_0_10_47_5]PIO03546.1 MAG: hypothetical protein COT48_04440 [Candidatus Woesearchaeota archaeon CG08_land_8_20_14_0_20_47_9]
MTCKVGSKAMVVVWQMDFRYRKNPDLERKVVEICNRIPTLNESLFIKIKERQTEHQELLKKIAGL